MYMFKQQVGILLGLVIINQSLFGLPAFDAMVMLLCVCVFHFVLVQLNIITVFLYTPCFVFVLAILMAECRKFNMMKSFLI